MVKGLEVNLTEKQLRLLGLFCLEERRLRGGLIAVFNIFKTGSGGAGTDPFTLMTSDTTQGNGLMLSQGRFRLDISKRLFTQKGD